MTYVDAIHRGETGRSGCTATVMFITPDFGYEVYSALYGIETDAYGTYTTPAVRARFYSYQTIQRTFKNGRSWPKCRTLKRHMALQHESGERKKKKKQPIKKWEIWRMNAPRVRVTVARREETTCLTVRFKFIGGWSRSWSKSRRVLRSRGWRPAGV